MTCHAARRGRDLERRLERERCEVCHALLGTDAELVGLEGAHSGELIDDAASETTCRLLARLEERDRSLLAEIDAAEARIARGVFGVCERCARPIESARLGALPTARLCIACAHAILKDGRAPRLAMTRAAARDGVEGAAAP